MEEKIKIGKEELEKFYTKSGSQHFKLQTEVFREYGNKKLDIYFKLVEFTNQIVTIIGLIAGLGFTALSAIQQRLLFVTGEGFLFIGIFFGIYLVHSVYSGELISLQKAQNIHRKHFRERNEVFKKIWEGLNTNGADPEDIKLLIKIDKETLEIFNYKDEGEDWIKKIRSHQRMLLYLLAGGCISILLSIIV